jgi:hypothetical protein
MFTRHHLTCQRASCGRAFTATRSDARFCSRSCRRDKTPASAPRIRAAHPSPAVEELAAIVDADDLDGWRRVGPYLIPPFDERNVIHTDWPR